MYTEMRPESDKIKYIMFTIPDVQHWTTCTHVKQSSLISWYLNEMSWNIVHTTQIFITIFETIYCLLSFPINMFCSPFASWSGSFQLAENMGYVQSFLCCMTTLSIYVGSNQLLGHFHPEIQQVISCFQSNVFVRCSVQNFKGIYKTHFHL